MLSHRDRIKRIIAREPADRCGMWLGEPSHEAAKLICAATGAADMEAVRSRYGDDLRWLSPQWSSYRHPRGEPMFFLPDAENLPLGTPGPLADCESVEEARDYHYPSAEYLDFTDSLQALDEMGDVYRAGGMWCCFFHNVMNYFGIEEYFIKMHTHPEVVEAVTERLCAFYLDANARFFAQAGGRIDALFIGNDLGTQRGLFISPELLDRFVLPYIAEFIAQGKAHGYSAMLHSCGAVRPLIPRFIEMGVDILHPLQALAAGMDAESLVEFRDQIIFMGGIDTQELLVNGTPEAVRAEVRRVKSLLGPGLIVSPSHECILPNVPPENLLAMAEEAVK